MKNSGILQKASSLAVCGAILGGSVMNVGADAEYWLGVYDTANINVGSLGFLQNQAGSLMTNFELTSAAN
jgi:hypothetical protein